MGWSTGVKLQEGTLGEMRHRNNFNALRLLLASLVILSHAPELHEGNRNAELLTRIFGTLSFGELAVDGFFLLSGYLITQSWCNQPHWWIYMKKRVLRIYPAFIASSLVCILVIGPIVTSEANYFSEISGGALLLGMLTLIEPNLPSVFENRPHATINGSMWTIRWEFLCYLTVLAAGFAGVGNFRRVWTLLTVIVVGVWVAERLSTGTELHAFMIGFDHPMWRLGSFFVVGVAIFCITHGSY